MYLRLGITIKAQFVPLMFYSVRVLLARLFLLA